MRNEPFHYTISFFTNFSVALYGLCVPLLAVQLGATYTDLGLIGAVGSLVYALSCLVAGGASDRIGYQRTLAVSSGATALLVLLYPGATRIAHLIALSAATSFTMSYYWPALQAWTGKGSRRDLSGKLARYNLSWSTGVLLGPAVGGMLYAGSVALPFFLSAGFIGGVSLALFGFRFREIELAPEPETLPGVPTGNRFLYVAWVANFAAYFAAGIVRSLFPKLASDLGIAPGALGWIMAAIGTAQVATFFLLSRTDRWQFRLAPLVGAQLFGAAGLLLLVFGASVGVFALGLLTHGVLLSTTYSASIFYSLHAGGPGGRRSGFHEAIIGSGFLFGPLVGGFVAGRLGPRAPYLLAAAVLLVAIGIQARILKQPRGSRQPEVPLRKRAVGSPLA